MKTSIIALCGAALIAAALIAAALVAAALVAGAPAGFAQGLSSKTAGLQHKVSKKRHPAVSGYAPRREMQAGGSKKGNPGAFGYAPGVPGGSSSDITDSTRQAGGGGSM